MKFSGCTLSKYRPLFYVEDMEGYRISGPFHRYSDAVSKARERSCFIRGGVRINVCMPSFKVVGGRFESEVYEL